jgi:hypothetical protein
MNAGALPDARFLEEVELGTVLFARSLMVLEDGDG